MLRAALQQVRHQEAKMAKDGPEGSWHRSNAFLC